MATQQPYKCLADYPTPPTPGQAKGCLEFHWGSQEPFILGWWMTWCFQKHPELIAVGYPCPRCVTLFPDVYLAADWFPPDSSGWNGGTPGEWML